MTTAIGALHDRLATFSGYAAHRPGTYVGPNGALTTYKYNSFGELTNVLPPADGVPYTYGYDPLGNMTSITAGTLAIGAQYSMTPDANNRVGSVTDATGETLTFSYDAADRITAEVFSDGSSKQFGYTLLDLTTVTDRLGRTSSRLFDADRELLKSSESTRETDYAYYGDGTLLAMSDLRTPQTLFSRDIEGRLLNETYPGGLPFQYNWDALGRLASDSMADYSYAADGQVTDALYFDVAAEIAGVRSTGGETAISYDPSYPRITSISESETPNDAGTRTDYTYNSVPPFGTVSFGANRLASVATTYLFQANFSQVSQATPVMDKVNYSYDDIDRVSVDEVESFSSTTSSLPTMDRFEDTFFDSLGRVQFVNNALDTFTYSYGDITSRITGVTSTGGPPVALSYHSLPSDPLLAQISYAFGSNFAAGAQTASFSYKYNADGQVTTARSAVVVGVLGGISQSTSLGIHEYDAWGELNKTVLSGAFTGQVRYEYDASGNLTAVAPRSSITGTQAASFSYTPANQVASSSYDASPPVFDTVTGDTGTLGGASYRYDAKNRLIAAVRGSQESNFRYDGVGHMIYSIDFDVDSQITTNETFFVWCGNRICQSHDGNGNPVKAYFPQGFIAYPPAGQAAHGDPPASYYYVTDRLGSVSQVWGPSQPFQNSPLQNLELQSAYHYDDYGNRTPVGVPETVPSDVGFAGYFHHAATGLDFAEHRVYSAQYGRWLTRDPIGLAGGMNPYRYADDDPVSLADPSGYCPACLGAEVGAIGFAIYYAATAPTSLTWGQFVSGALDHGAAGAAVGFGAATAGTLFGGGTLVDALGISDSVTLAGAVGGSLVTPGGKLDQVLDAIAENYGTVNPTNTAQAFQVIQQATRQVGLDVGFSSLGQNGEIIITNAGGVITTLGVNGSIIVQRGSDDLLGLCPE